MAKFFATVPSLNGILPVSTSTRAADAFSRMTAQAKSIGMALAQHLREESPSADTNNSHRRQHIGTRAKNEQKPTGASNGQQAVYRYTESLAHSIEEILTGDLNVDMSDKFSTLYGLYDWLAQPFFLYDSEEDLHHCQGVLLALWVYLLKHIREVSVLHYRHLCYKIMSSFLRRQEFSCRLLHAQRHSAFIPFQSYQTAQNRSEDIPSKPKLFKKLVQETFVFVNGELGSDYSRGGPELLQLAANSCVTVLMMYTRMQIEVVEAVSSHLQHTEAAYKSADDSQLQYWFLQRDEQLNSLRRMWSSSSMPRKEVANSLPDLFDWSFRHPIGELDSFILECPQWKKAFSQHSLFVMYFFKSYFSLVEGAFAKARTPLQGFMRFEVPCYDCLFRLYTEFLFNALMLEVGNLSIEKSSPTNSSSSQEQLSVEGDICDEISECMEELLAVDVRLQEHEPIVFIRDTLTQDKCYDVADTVIHNPAALATIMTNTIQLIRGSSPKSCIPLLYHTKTWMISRGSLCESQILQETVDLLSVLIGKNQDAGVLYSCLLLVDVVSTLLDLQLRQTLIGDCLSSKMFLTLIRHPDVKIRSVFCRVVAQAALVSSTGSALPLPPMHMTLINDPSFVELDHTGMRERLLSSLPSPENVPSEELDDQLRFLLDDSLRQLWNNEDEEKSEEPHDDESDEEHFVRAGMNRKVLREYRETVLKLYCDRIFEDTTDSDAPTHSTVQRSNAHFANAG